MSAPLSPDPQSQAATALRHTGCAVVGLLLLAGAQAQSPTPKTMGDLIEQAKRQQRNNLTPPPAPPPPQRASAPPPPPLPAPAPAPAPAPVVQIPPPVLWSMSGINHELVAQVLYQQKMHVLHLHEGDTQIGPWVVQRYGIHGLHLIHTGSGRPATLFLPTPKAGTSLSRYLAALPLEPTQEAQASPPKAPAPAPAAPPPAAGTPPPAPPAQPPAGVPRSAGPTPVAAPAPEPAPAPQAKALGGPGLQALR